MCRFAQAWLLLRLNWGGGAQTTAQCSKIECVCDEKQRGEGKDSVFQHS